MVLADPPRSVKGFRATKELETIIGRLAQLEGVTEAVLLERMVDEFLAARSPIYAQIFPQAQAVVSSTPESVGAALAELRRVLALDLSPQPPPVAPAPIRYSAAERMAAVRRRASAGR